MTEPSLLVPVRLIAFDACHLDVARHRLRRGEHDLPAAQVVGSPLLSRRAARPARHQEALYREIRPDTAVSDNTLTQVSIELRQALGDTPRTPCIIETARRRGFRFVAQVRSVKGGPEG
jgi:DNA-binding winged helix-turn-helix (wHTH) protein